MVKKLLSIKFICSLMVLSTSITLAQNALHFQSSNNYVQTDCPGVSGNNPITVEAIIKTGGANNEQIITTWGSESYNGGRFTFRVNAVGSNDVIRIENKGGGINGTINVNDGNWHHVAVTYDPTPTTNRYKLYVDGVLDTQGNISTALNVGTDTNIIIGRRINPSFGGFFDGPIDEVRIWNVALTQAQISEYKDKSICAQTNLIAYFKMDEGVASGNNTTINQITDSSGNSFVGSLISFTLNGATSNFIAANNVTPISFDTTVTSSSNTLTVAESSSTASFQWVDCDNANAPINNETNASFTPTTNGNYAVIVTKSGCTETSTCQAVTLGVNSNEFARSISMYPNPTNGITNIQLNQSFETIEATVYNVTGQTILNKEFNNTNTFSVDFNSSNGIYFLAVKTNSGENAVLKVIKQ